MRHVFADPPLEFPATERADPPPCFVDRHVPPNPRPMPVPKPWRNPPVMELEEVIGRKAVDEIRKAGRIVFHAVGDTGGVKHPEHQLAVAKAMSKDLAGRTYAQGRPAFFFHLGDIVYYYGEEKDYYDQFYEPYRDYDAPIFAIPGNHDGMVLPGRPSSDSLKAFLNNFCTRTPKRSAAAPGIARTTMTQPGVYFALNCPFVKIIGLYSNTAEGSAQGMIRGPGIGDAQVRFLHSQLSETAVERKKGHSRALVLAVHHPPFTASTQHAPSPPMLADVDRCCHATRTWPDLILSGHAHLYERYSRTVSPSGRAIVLVVAGSGGYFNLCPSCSSVQAGADVTEASGNSVCLEASDNKHFGYLRVVASTSGAITEFKADRKVSAAGNVVSERGPL